MIWSEETHTMNFLVVGAVFGAAFLVALLALYVRHAAWYWHVLSVAAAVAIGLYRFPDAYRPPDLLTGAVFIFLFVWGAGEIVMHPFHLRARSARSASMMEGA